MRMIDTTRRAMPVLVILATASISTTAARADHNFDCQGAHPIGISTPWTGTVSSSDFDDWYLHSAFPLPVHGYTLTVTGGNCANRRLLCSSTEVGTATDECTAIGGSDHRIQVRYKSGGTVAYRLDVSNLP